MGEIQKALEAVVSKLDQAAASEPIRTPTQGAAPRSVAEIVRTLTEQAAMWAKTGGLVALACLPLMGCGEDEEPTTGIVVVTPETPRHGAVRAFAGTAGEEMAAMIFGPQAVLEARAWD